MATELCLSKNAYRANTFILVTSLATFILATFILATNLANNPGNTLLFPAHHYRYLLSCREYTRARFQLDGIVLGHGYRVPDAPDQSRDQKSGNAKYRPKKDSSSIRIEHVLLHIREAAHSSSEAVYWIPDT